MSKSIVITGATRGLGLAMTRFFATQGHTIHGCGRNAAAVAELQKEFRSPHTFKTLDRVLPSLEGKMAGLFKEN